MLERIASEISLISVSSAVERLLPCSLSKLIKRPNVPFGNLKTFKLSEYSWLFRLIALALWNRGDRDSLFALAALLSAPVPTMIMSSHLTLVLNRNGPPHLRALFQWLPECRFTRACPTAPYTVIGKLLSFCDGEDQLFKKEWPKKPDTTERMGALLLAQRPSTILKTVIARTRYSFPFHASNALS